MQDLPHKQQLALFFGKGIHFFGIGKVERDLAMSCFCRNLGLLIKRGIPLDSALKVLIGTSSYPGLDRSIRGVISGLQSGLPLGEALRAESRGLVS